MKLKPGRSPEDHARKVLPRLARRFLKAGRKSVRRNASLARLHRFRLRAKRFRYTLELFAPLYGPEMEMRLAALKKLQQALGDINDCEATMSLKAVKNDPEFVAWLRQRQREDRNKLQQLWKADFAHSDVDDDWIRFLEEPHS
jgi:CHAD domain-containing protein